MVLAKELLIERIGFDVARIAVTVGVIEAVVSGPSVVKGAPELAKEELPIDVVEAGLNGVVATVKPIEPVVEPDSLICGGALEAGLNGVAATAKPIEPVVEPESLVCGGAFEPVSNTLAEEKPAEVEPTLADAGGEAAI